jgi:hypothetical protein
MPSTTAQFTVCRNLRGMHDRGVEDGLVGKQRIKTIRIPAFYELMPTGECVSLHWGSSGGGVALQIPT